MGVLLAAQQPSLATVFFSDTFTNGSTLNSLTPAAPTETNTSYEIMSAKAWNPTPSIAAGHLQFGIAPSTSGTIEVQALFGSAPVSLVLPDDFIQLTVTFTNTSGILIQNGFWGFGLYNAGGVAPIGGGLNGTATSTGTGSATGGAQNWQGYVAQIAYTGSTSGFYDRRQQTGANNNNQDLVTSGSSSSSYRNPSAAAVGSGSTTPSVTLTAGNQYTEILTYTLTASGALQLDSKLYAGPDNTGTLLSSMTATNAGTPLTTTFDGFAFGWRVTANTSATAMDVNSITVSGHSTIITTPPSIDGQPVSISAAPGSLAFFSVSASGYGMTYQWHRNGTNLVNAGNISGATSANLIISPVSAADAVSSYYVTVTGTGGYTTNSTTASLSLRTAASLTWLGSSSIWDVANTANWSAGVSTVAFNQGDLVAFDDSGSLLTVDKTGSYLSPGSITVNSSYNYTLQGSGSIVGPAKLDYVGSGRLIMSTPNTYSGGTLVSNDTAVLVLLNQSALGSGTVTLAKAGGSINILATGGNNVGLGSVVVADDFTINCCSNTYGAVFLGDLSGTSGKTLTLNSPLALGLPATTCRARFYGANTICDANLNLNDSILQMAPYQAGGYNQTYNGVISGSGSLIQRANGTTILNGANTYSGGTIPTTGAIALGCDTTGSVSSGPIGTGPLLLAPEIPNTGGSGMILAWGGARTIANPVQYASYLTNLTLIIGGTNALTLSGTVALQGNDNLGATNRTFQVTNTALTAFSGVISDGGLACGLIKTGNGVLALNNTETYTGPTTVSAGTLQVNGQLSTGAVTVATNSTLAGTGTILGPVSVAVGGAVAPGASGIGTLTLNNGLALAGNLRIEVNNAGSPTSDQVVVSGTLTNSGTGQVTVSNLGGALAPGNSFTLFNKQLLNGNALTVSGAGAIWTNKLAIDGTIAVEQLIATTGTNLTLSVSGTNLTLSWPPNYLTWTLQSNAVSVVSTNWYAVPNSSNVTSMQFPINPSKTNVFYRLYRQVQ